MTTKTASLVLDRVSYSNNRTLVERREEQIRLFDAFCHSLGFKKADNPITLRWYSDEIDIELKFRRFSSYEFEGVEVDPHPRYGWGQELRKRTIKFPVDGEKLRTIVKTMAKKRKELSARDEAAAKAQKENDKKQQRVRDLLAAELKRLGVESELRVSLGQYSFNAIEIKFGTDDLDDALAFVRTVAPFLESLRDK